MINRTQHKSKAPDSKQRWHRPPSNEGGFFTWLSLQGTFPFCDLQSADVALHLEPVLRKIIVIKKKY